MTELNQATPELTEAAKAIMAQADLQKDKLPGEEKLVDETFEQPAELIN